MENKAQTQIEVFHQHPSLRFPQTFARSLVSIVLEKEGQKANAINIVFVNDAKMKELHWAYFKKKSGTDVISFRLNNEEIIEGEVYVCLDQARRQAATFAQTYREEVARLIVHGTLHLAGYDDATPQLRGGMAMKEDLYLQHFYKKVLHNVRTDS